MNKLAAAAAIGIAAALVSAPLSAQAVDPWPVGDEFDVGSASYQFDQYGLAYVWDAADVYDPSGYMYYPMEFYWDNADYFYCGDVTVSTSDYQNSTVNTLANGDVTIDCPSWEVTTYPGLFITMHFRMYAAQSGGGYLIRQWAELENTTGADISLSSLSSYQYPNGYTWSVATGNFLTSSGATTPAGIDLDDSWFISGENDGSSVYQTTVWAKTASAPAYGIESSSASNNPINDFTTSGLTIPAGKTLNFLQFTNVTVPATADASGASAAFTAAQAQASEFDQFTGRLVDGLDPSLEYIGWGVPVVPALASTGTDTVALLPIVGGAAGLALLGVAAVVLTRRRPA